MINVSPYCCPGVGGAPEDHARDCVNWAPGPTRCSMCGRTTKRVETRHGRLYCQDRRGCQRRWAKMHALPHTVLLRCPAHLKKDRCNFTGTDRENRWSDAAKAAHLDSPYHREHRGQG